MLYETVDPCSLLSGSIVILIEWFGCLGFQWGEGRARNK